MNSVNESDPIPLIGMALSFAIVHFVLFDGFFVISEGGWAYVELLLLLASVFYSVTLWRYRKNAMAIDRVAFFMPVATWIGSVVVMKVIAAFGRSGVPRHDKGLFNVLGVEPAVVGALVALYSIVFYFAAGRRSRSVRQGVLIALCIATAAVAWLFPALND